jgi:hypothetical protein
MNRSALRSGSVSLDFDLSYDLELPLDKLYAEFIDTKMRNVLFIIDSIQGHIY